MWERKAAASVPAVSTALSSADTTTTADVSTTATATRIDDNGMDHYLPGFVDPELNVAPALFPAPTDTYSRDKITARTSTAECIPGSRWKDGCKHCRCDDYARAVCSLRHCSSKNSGKEKEEEKKEEEKEEEKEEKEPVKNRHDNEASKKHHHHQKHHHENDRQGTSDDDEAVPQPRTPRTHDEAPQARHHLPAPSLHPSSEAKAHARTRAAGSRSGPSTGMTAICVCARAEVPSVKESSADEAGRA